MEIEFLVRIAYHIGISPFRFILKGGLVEIKESKSRRVICGCIQASHLVTHMIFFVYPHVVGGLNQGNPRVLFDIPHVFTGTASTTSMLYVLWFRKHQLKQLVMELGVLEGQKTNRGTRITKFVLVTGMLVAVTPWVFPNSLFSMGMLGHFLGCHALGNLTIPQRNMIPFIGWIKAFESKIGNNCNLFQERALILLQFLESLHYFVLLGVAFSLVLASSVSVYRVASDLRNFVEMGAPRFKILEQYVLAARRIGLVNKVASVPILIVTLKFTMFFSLTLPWLLINTNAFYLSNLGTASFIIGSLMVAAEANRLMTEVGKFLTFSFQSSASNTAVALWSCPGDCGLRGWHFFTVSYSFIGSLGSIIFTYVLVVFQLIH